MSNTYNEIRGIYRVGRDCEQRYTPSGTAVASFSAASTYEYKEASGEKKKVTTWLQVSAYGKLAEICGQYVKKGMLVEIIGRLTPDKSTGGPRIYDKQDGTKGASYEVSASTVRFLSSREDGGGVGNTGGNFVGAPEDDDGQIPF